MTFTFCILLIYLVNLGILFRTSLCMAACMHTEFCLVHSLLVLACIDCILSLEQLYWLKTLCTRFTLQVEGSLGHSSVDKKTCQSDTVPWQMSIQLPDLVSLVHHIFQSVNFSPITKEELVHKIILDSLDIVDRSRSRWLSLYSSTLHIFLIDSLISELTQSTFTGEVEEQIGILEKQVPDWICRLPAPSGDVLYRWVYNTSLWSLMQLTIHGEKCKEMLWDT